LEAELTFKLSGSGSVKAVLMLERAGHLSHGRCVAGRSRRRRGCTSYLTVLTITRTGLRGGRVAIPVPTRIHGRRLPRGSYLLRVSSFGPGGQRGGSVTLALRLVAV
jgi:hypothetical protein